MPGSLLSTARVRHDPWSTAGVRRSCCLHASGQVWSGKRRAAISTEYAPGVDGSVLASGQVEPVCYHGDLLSRGVMSPNPPRAGMQQG